MTYVEAQRILGAHRVQYFWRKPRIEDCLAEVSALRDSCGATGLQHRREAYQAVIEAMEQQTMEQPEEGQD